MASTDNPSPHTVSPGTFLAITFTKDGSSITTYGEVAQARGDTLQVRCLSPEDFAGMVKGKALRLRFPFTGRPDAVDAMLAEIHESSIAIRLRDTGREASRRILLRGGTVLPIHVFLSAGRVIGGRTVNVSAGGAMVVLSELPESGADVLFRLTLPDEPSAAIQGQAKVAWARKVAGENQVGLTFMALETPEIRRLCRVAFRAAAHSMATE